MIQRIGYWLTVKMFNVVMYWFFFFTEPENVVVEEPIITNPISIDYNASANIRFSPSCNLNGRLKNIRLYYEAAKENEESFNFTFDFNATLQTTQHWIPLKPEYKYRYHIQTYTEHNHSNTTGWKRIYAPAGGEYWLLKNGSIIWPRETQKKYFQVSKIAAIN